MKYSPSELIQLRREKTDMRDRVFAESIGLSEGELIAAYCASGEAIRLNIDFFKFLENAHKLGPIMALTRNETAVSEITGAFSKVFPGKIISFTLGEIDLRIIGPNWAFGFAREIEIMKKKCATMQFFDHQGKAVFKMYQKDHTNMGEWKNLINLLKHDDQSGVITVSPSIDQEQKMQTFMPDIEKFRTKWASMTDVHQLHNILKEMKIDRHDALKFVGQEYAHELTLDAVELMLDEAHNNQVPIMCFIGNHGCIQIFTGKIGPKKWHDNWLNLFDETFHLHMDIPSFAHIWSVRKPTKYGILHSIEVFNKSGELVIQFFGQRQEQSAERSDWRNIVENLPPLGHSAVA